MSDIKPSVPVFQYDLDGNFIKEYPSIRSAGKYFGGKESDWMSIRDCLRRRTKKAKKIAHGYRWDYKLLK